MRDFIAGFKHGVLELFAMPFIFLNSAVKPSESITGEKQATDREYTPDPDYQPPVEEFTTITREVN